MIAAALCIISITVPVPGQADPMLTSEAIASALRDRLELLSAEQTPGIAPALGPDLRRFYEGRDYRPAWSSEENSPDRELALKALSSSMEEGLDPTHYHLDFLLRTLSPKTPSEAAAWETVLTGSLLRFSTDMHVGRVHPADVGRDVSLPAVKFDAVNALSQALARRELEELVRSLSPPLPQYSGLKAALGRYRLLQATGGWPSVPSWSALKPLDDGQRLAAVSRRLALEEPASVSDVDARSALLRYQARNGLEVDGRVGPNTLAMLSVPIRDRIGQIMANMERWRWLPRQAESRYILVNTADAQLIAVVDGNTVLSSRVIVGDKNHPSPIMKVMATAITANPPWNVPPSIARKEILPKLRRNPSYLASEDMVLLNGAENDPHGLTVDWRKVSASRFPYLIQQRPGPRNALGLIKVEMPNRFDVYLHDTPTPHLFSSRARFLSHGCIRVEQIVPLASFVLTGDPNEGIERLQQAVADGTTKRLSLREPVPVYLLYWTAIAWPDGAIGFRSDIYGRDLKTLRSLQGSEHSLVAGRESYSGGCPALA